MRKSTLFAISFAIRMVLIVVADYIDRVTPTSKYTDTDYFVFSDAATAVYKGGSPYERHTYRYTPLVAYICLINNYIHPASAKVLWCICDLILGNLMWKMLDIVNKGNKSLNHKIVASWLLCPLVWNMSTRGSNDNTISLLVFITLYYLQQRKYLLAGFFFGLSVHFKIYPIIYSIVFYFYIDCNTALIE